MVGPLKMSGFAKTRGFALTFLVKTTPKQGPQLQVRAMRG